MRVFSKYMFKGVEILQQFYLGYCMTDAQTYEVSEPNFTGLRNLARNPMNSMVHQVNQHLHEGGEIFIPLMDDWFFKPLLYIKKTDDANL